MSQDNLVMLRRGDFTTAKVSAAPIVSMTIKDGKIQFNHAASRLLGLKDGVFVEVGYDKDNPKKIWFRKGVEENGFRVHLRVPKRKTGAHCIISKPLVRHIQKLLDTDYNISAQMGTEMQDGVFWILESSYQLTKPKTLKKNKE